MPATEERPTDAEKKDTEKKDTEARISILHWREAKDERDRALAELEALAQAPGTPGDAQNVIDQYQNACDEFEDADTKLGKTSHVLKHHRERHEARVAQAQERAQWFQEQGQMSMTDITDRQQAHEQERIRLETRRAALAMEARRGPMSPAPGTEGHPPDQPVALDRFHAPVVTADPFAASKAADAASTAFQDASRTPAAAPGQATRQPADTMTAGRQAEAAAPSLQEEVALEQREVDQRAGLLRESERQTAVEAQGEHQIGGPAHGRVENKKGGYDVERKGARPEKPASEKEKK